MALLQELTKENLLLITLNGLRAVLKRELQIPEAQFVLTETFRQEMIRKQMERGQPLEFPYSYLLLNSLAGSRDTCNNYAVRRHGMANTSIGEKATTKKAYLFPIKMGLEFHYIDSNQNRVLNMAMALALFSATSGLKFDINVGDLFTFSVSLEIPLDYTINIQEEQSQTLPEAVDLTTSIIVSTSVGYFKDVAAVHGKGLTMSVTLPSGDEEQFGYLET